jgi:hypothetical protein
MTMPISNENEILFNEIMAVDNEIIGFVAAIDYNDIIVI